MQCSRSWREVIIGFTDSTAHLLLSPSIFLPFGPLFYSVRRAMKRSRILCWSAICCFRRRGKKKTDEGGAVGSIGALHCDLFSSAIPRFAVLATTFSTPATTTAAMAARPPHRLLSRRGLVSSSYFFQRPTTALRQSGEDAERRGERPSPAPRIANSSCQLTAAPAVEVPLDTPEVLRSAANR